MAGMRRQPEKWEKPAAVCLKRVVKKVCEAAKDAAVIASHLDSVSHATLTGNEARAFDEEQKLTRVLVSHSGETIEL
jgi:hypothetical protein